MADDRLAAAIARAAPERFTLYLLSIGTPDPGADWLSLGELGDEARLRAALTRVGADAGVDRDDVLTQWMAEWLGWIVGHPAVALLAAERLVPVVPAGGAAVLLADNGRPAGLRLREAACHGGDDAALAHALVAQTAAALDPAIATLARIGRRAPQALWRGASDRLAHAFFQEARGDPALLALARDALGAPGPLSFAPDYREDASGALAHVRRGCCLAHAVGLELCVTCPLEDHDGDGARAVVAE